MSMSLTPAQRKLLAYIKRYMRAARTAPTFNEMSAHMGCGRGRVSSLLTGLEERGAIRRLRYRARAIEILDDKRSAA